MAEGRRTGARVVASIILVVGIAVFVLLAWLVVMFGCTWDGSCGARENVTSIVVTAAAAALLGYALWRIWRR